MSCYIVNMTHTIKIPSTPNN